MIYNVNGIEISSEMLNKYFDTLINKIFAILGVYEDCEEINDFSSYDIYLDRVLTELTGGYYMIGFDNFVSLSNILTGIKYSETINHRKVKSLVFHCISMVKKMKVEESGDLK